MREKKVTDVWLAGLPKLDLHCHLDGSLSLAAIRRLAKKAGVELPAEDGALQNLLHAPADCTSLLDYLKCFDLPLACLQSGAALEEAAYDLVLQAAADGVVYLEVRFAPLLSVQGQLSAEVVVEAVCQGLCRGEQETGTHAQAILCGMRHHEPEQNVLVARLAQQYLGRGVCAVDLAGDEASFPPGLHRRFFVEAARLNVPFTIHAGESAGVENVRHSIRLGARRIGHGTAMRGHPEVLRLCAQNGIGIELCLSSNVQTKAVSGWEELPLLEFLESGALVSLHTDNRTVSGTTSTRELQLACEWFDLDKDDCRRLMLHAALTAFADDGTKLELIRRIEAYI